MSISSSPPPGLSGQAVTSVIPPALYAGAAASATTENARATAYFSHNPLPTLFNPVENPAAWGHILAAGPEMLHRVVLSEVSDGFKALPYLTVPSDLRTLFSTQLAYIEAFQIYFDTVLRHESFSDYAAVKSLEIMIGHVQTIISEVANAIDHQGRHPRVLIEKLVSQLQGQNKSAHVIRVEPNMGDANKVDDHDGRFGTGLKEETYQWMCQKFGQANVFVDPVGTAFFARVNDPCELESIFNTYPFGVKMNLASEHGARIGKKGVSQFVPHVAVYCHEITAQKLNRRKHPNGFEGALLQELRYMSAAVHYFKKSYGGYKKHVYTSQDIGHNRRLVESLARKGVNYVGFESYRADRSSPVDSLKARKALLTNSLSQGGGLLELLEQARLGLGCVLDIYELAAQCGVNDNAFGELSALVGVSTLNSPGQNDGATAPISLKDVVRFGLESMRDPRNASLIKADPILFAQELVRKKYRRMIVSEVDFGKAFLEAYPPALKNDERDSDFQYTREVWFEVAREMGLVDQEGNPEVIISAIEGDQIIVSCGDVDRDGNIINIDDYVSRVHQRVKERFADRPFQVTHKVHDPVTGVQTRTPLWYHPALGSYQLSLEKPSREWEPVMTQLSISSAYGVSPQSFGLADNETHPDRVWKTFTEWAQVIDTQIKFQGRYVVVNGERVAITKGAASRYSMVA